ncbi:hypothetical protein HK102_002131 [Quaeritorhiza haematococci]|nr:hypothetical protein HK102_002131 [Quaeritorhiza haematococci]
MVKKTNRRKSNLGSSKPTSSSASASEPANEPAVDNPTHLQGKRKAAALSDDAIATNENPHQPTLELSHVPYVVFRGILNNLSISDLIKLSATSKYFHGVVLNDDSLWHERCARRFPLFFCHGKCERLETSRSFTSFTEFQILTQRKWESERGEEKEAEPLEGVDPEAKFVDFRTFKPSSAATTTNSFANATTSSSSNTENAANPDTTTIALPLPPSPTDKCPCSHTILRTMSHNLPFSKIYQNIITGEFSGIFQLLQDNSYASDSLYLDEDINLKCAVYLLGKYDRSVGVWKVTDDEEYIRRWISGERTFANFAEPKFRRLRGEYGTFTVLWSDSDGCGQVTSTITAAHQIVELTQKQSSSPHSSRRIPEDVFQKGITEPYMTRSDFNSTQILSQFAVNDEVEVQWRARPTGLWMWTRGFIKEISTDTQGQSVGWIKVVFPNTPKFGESMSLTVRVSGTAQKKAGDEGDKDGAAMAIDENGTPSDDDTKKTKNQRSLRRRRRISNGLTKETPASSSASSSTPTTNPLLMFVDTSLNGTPIQIGGIRKVTCIVQKYLWSLFDDVDAWETSDSEMYDSDELEDDFFDSDDDSFDYDGSEEGEFWFGSDEEDPDAPFWVEDWFDY